MTYTVKRLEAFSNWLRGLKDELTRQRLIKRLRKAQGAAWQPWRCRTGG
jgi:putative component of toxin-antitoxin plasmid stabilization module